MIKSTYIKGTTSLSSSYTPKAYDKDQKVESKAQSKFTSVQKIQENVFEASKKPFSQGNDNMKSVSVYSNSARSKTLILDGKLTLHFNAEGYAVVPVHLISILENEMSARPGRYTIMGDLPQLTKSAPVLGEETLAKEELKDILKTLKESFRKKAEEPKPEEVKLEPEESKELNTEGSPVVEPESEESKVKKGPGRPRRKE